MPAQAIAHELGPVATEPGSGVPAKTGSYEHRIETARWALETFDPSTPVYKQAAKVVAAYLGGKPLPQA